MRVGQIWDRVRRVLRRPRAKPPARLWTTVLDPNRFRDRPGHGAAAPRRPLRPRRAGGAGRRRVESGRGRSERHPLGRGVPGAAAGGAWATAGREGAGEGTTRGGG